MLPSVRGALRSSCADQRRVRLQQLRAQLTEPRDTRESSLVFLVFKHEVLRVDQLLVLLADDMDLGSFTAVGACLDNPLDICSRGVDVLAAKDVEGRSRDLRVVLKLLLQRFPRPLVDKSLHKLPLLVPEAQRHDSADAWPAVDDQLRRHGAAVVPCAHDDALSKLLGILVHHVGVRDRRLVVLRRGVGARRVRAHPSPVETNHWKACASEGPVHCEWQRHAAVVRIHDGIAGEQEDGERCFRRSFGPNSHKCLQASNCYLAGLKLTCICWIS
mmetsp:Transcript_91054/g.253522  ORF Transcript_91054/g.253522 Transcript_91054/m.253522 type:complete len:273 (+) Transcript_91054:72-890(+)